MRVKIFGIRDKDTGDFREFNNKTCWKSVAAAKSSFLASRGESFTDHSDTFEVIELTEIVFMYEELCK